MHDDDLIPDAVRIAIDATIGEIRQREPLGGMSGAGVERLHGRRGTLVLKRTRHPTELAVYQSVAPTLRNHGIALPECYGMLEDGDLHWLLLEDIPTPFPRERWIADAEQLGMLARLHALPGDILTSLRERYRPVWDDALTEAAASLLPAVDPGMLREVQAASQPLFAEAAPISGDPNPLNWGLRDDGSLVLFDWERLTLATPAIDLAITVPGLPDTDVYRRTAERYVEVAGSRDDVSTLVERMRLAKLWTIVELLAGVVHGEVERNATIDWVIANVGRVMRGA